MRSILRQFFIENKNGIYHSVEIDGSACSFFGIISKIAAAYHLVTGLTKQLPHIAHAHLIHEYNLAIVQLHLAHHFY